MQPDRFTRGRSSETNQLLGKQHYDEHIIEPMLRSLFPVFDIIIDYRKHNHHPGCNAKGLIDSVSSLLRQFLATYDVEMFEHSPGDTFDPKSMRPIGWESTADKQLENSIAQSLQAGFKLGQSKILRQETVQLFKYELLEKTF